MLDLAELEAQRGRGSAGRCIDVSLNLQVDNPSLENLDLPNPSLRGFSSSHDSGNVHSDWGLFD